MALVLVFALAAWQRFALPLTPIADPDFWGYLSPALRKLIGSEFGHTQGRNFLYPGLLYLLLRASGDFRAITITLGIAAGGMFLLTWRRLRVFVPESLVSLRLHDGLGLVGAATYLLAAETTRIETQLRPEAVCGFLLSLNLYFTLQFIYYSFISERRTAALVYGSASVLSLLFLASARPSFWFTAIVVMVPLAAFFVRRNWWPQKIGLAVATVLSGMLVLWPEHVLSRNDEVSQTFLPTMLFVIHADLIRDQMAADLKENASLPFARDWLERVYTALNAEIVKSEIKYPGHYPSLKFDPEYLWFEPGSISTQLHREFGHNVSALCAFYRFYYWRTWQYQPLRQLQKVTSQFSIYYFPKCPATARLLSTGRNVPSFGRGLSKNFDFIAGGGRFHGTNGFAGTKRAHCGTAAPCSNRVDRSRARLSTLARGSNDSQRIHFLEIRSPETIEMVGRFSPVWLRLQRLQLSRRGYC